MREESGRELGERWERQRQSEQRREKERVNLEEMAREKDGEQFFYYFDFDLFLR
jgi:hypothetical protein